MTSQMLTMKLKQKAKQPWALAPLHLHTFLLPAPTTWKEEDVDELMLFIRWAEQKAKLKERSENQDAGFSPPPPGTSWHRTIGRSLTSLNLKVLMGYMSSLTSVLFPSQDFLRTKWNKHLIKLWKKKFQVVFLSVFYLISSRFLQVPSPSNLPSFFTLIHSIPPVIALLPLVYPFILCSLVFSSFCPHFVFSLSLFSVSVDSGNVNKRISYHLP